MPYRFDVEKGARDRARLLAQLWDLEGRFTNVFWRELAPSLSLARLGVEVHRVARRTEDDVRRQIASLERILAVWPDIRERWERPARRAPRGAGSSRASGRYLNATLEEMEIREELERVLPSVPVGIPLDLRIISGGQVRWAIATSAPLGAGAVGIETERLLDDLRKMAGLLTDIEVGDSTFDGAFLVRGHESTARNVLDRSTRQALLRLGERSRRMRVLLADGEAKVELRADVDAPIVDDVIAVLEALRRAPIRPLRRDLSEAA